MVSRRPFKLWKPHALCYSQDVPKEIEPLMLMKRNLFSNFISQYSLYVEHPNHREERSFEDLIATDWS